MKISVLASGSKGNATYIETTETKILIDLGISALHLTKKLNNIGVDPTTIDAILLTHAHSDHISGLKVFLKKNNPLLFLTKKTYNYLSSKISLTNFYIIDKYESYKDIDIEIINTSHDVPSVGFIIKNDGKELVYITDTGYLHTKYFPSLANKDIYIIESNHDVELLLNGTYPFELKQRILSDKGHLSNRDCAYYLSKLIGDNTKQIFLAHLSENNNHPDIAYETLKNTFKENNIEFDNIVITTQDEETELVEV